MTKLHALLRVILAIIASLCIGLALAGGGPIRELHVERLLTLAIGVLLIPCIALPSRLLEQVVPLALFSLAACVAAEWVLRLAVGPEFATNVVLDQRLLHRIEPGSEKRYRQPAVNGGEAVSIEIDSRGYRRSSNRDGVTASSPVLVLGDSFIEGESTLAQLTFAERLSGFLTARADDPSISVLNGGVIGYGPDQVLLRMQDDISLVRPRAVVVGIYAGNDYGDLMRNRLVSLDVDGRLLTHTPVLDPALVRKFERGRRRWMIGRLISRIRNAPDGVPVDSTTVNAKARELVSNWMSDRRAEDEAAARGISMVSNLFDDTPDVDMSADIFSGQSERKMTLMVAVIDSVNRLAAAHSTPVLFVLVPSAIDVVDGYDGGQVDLAAYPAYRRDVATGELAKRLRARGIAVVDLFPAFQSSMVPLYYVAGDNHWNPSGQELAAQIVSDSLVARGWHGPRAPGG